MFARRTEWPLQPNPLTREIARRRKLGLPVLDLTESNPTQCGFRYEAETILGALANPSGLIYSPDPRGALRARQAIAEYYSERSVALDVEHIFLTASTSEAYSYLFRLLGDPGDCVLVPRPSYPLFDFLAGLNDLEIIPYRLTYASDWRIDLGELTACLERAGRTFQLPRALVVVHPNNPTGSFVHRDEISPLLDLCRRHNLSLIADEVFADYGIEAPRVSNQTYDAARTHASIDSVLTFTLSGLSKVCGLPQMKLAWIVVSGPAEERERAIERLEIIADTYLSVSTPVASALPAMIETRRTLQPQIRARVKQNLEELDSQLREDSRATRLEVEGGWYAVLKLPNAIGRDGARQGLPEPDGSSDEGSLAASDFAIDLAREDGVLVHPGHFYEFPSDDHLVLSLIPPKDGFAGSVQKLLARLTSKSK